VNRRAICARDANDRSRLGGSRGSGRTAARPNPGSPALRRQMVRDSPIPARSREEPRRSHRRRQPRGDGKIDVLNSGPKNDLDGKCSSVRAVAWVPDSSRSGALKVRFFGLFASDYLVFGLDQVNYSWALVGNNSRDFLWFLSMTQTVSPELLAAMENRRRAKGMTSRSSMRFPRKRDERKLA
jgi:lipocalin